MSQSFQEVRAQFAGCVDEILIRTSGLFEANPDGDIAFFCRPGAIPLSIHSVCYLDLQDPKGKYEDKHESIPVESAEIRA